MARYIDREKMLKYLEENNTADEWIIGQYNADWIYSFIESQPTADVVEVVRCKDCKQFMEYAEGVKSIECANGDCFIRMMHSIDRQFCGVKYDDFCSYGERKETDG